MYMLSVACTFSEEDKEGKLFPLEDIVKGARGETNRRGPNKIYIDPDAEVIDYYVKQCADTVFNDASRTASEHNISYQLLSFMLSNRMMNRRNVTDGNGGLLSDGFVFCRCDGLYAPSLDRAVDSLDSFYCIHFPDPGNALKNINALLSTACLKA